jgi:Domain of unknown function (DUF4350)
MTLTDTPVRRGVATQARRAGWPVAIVGLVVAAVALTLLVSGKGNSIPLDPNGAGPDGARALAQVLDHHGVDVVVERDQAGFVAAAQADRTATLMVSQTDLLSDDDVAAMRRDMTNTGRPVVLVAPSQRQLDVLAPGVRLLDVVPGRVVDPQCTDPVASRAGAADAGGHTYAIDNGLPATGCYPVGGAASYLVVSNASPTVIIGQADLLTNQELARDGNAALAIGALGRSDAVIWFVPGGEGVGTAQHSLGSVLPSWVGWVVLQLLVVTLICMLWRGRRLGRLVPEPLPVIVRAVETTEGRARMYRRSRAHDRAAATLRAATISRLRERTGLGRATSPADVVAVVAARTGRPGADVAAILLGPPPTDDAGLVRLAQTLDQLDREVRRP